MTWDGVVTKFHKQHMREIGVTDHIEAYIQSIVMKKTLELVSMEYRRGIEEGLERRDDVDRCVEEFAWLLKFYQ